MEFNFNHIQHIPSAHSIGNNQIRALFRWARVCDGNAVEIGSFYGRSTAVIAHGLKIAENGGKVFAVDPHASRVSRFDFFLENLKKSGIRDRVIPVRERSEIVLKQRQPKELFDTKIGLLFIDGQHTYEQLKMDLGWVDLVYRGGVIAFHDYTEKYPGIVKAITEYQETHHEMYQYELLGSMIIFKKL
ncbi:MAG: class I SAM-dependent methyltransferase [Dehalococcoidales bacterium]